MNQEQDVQTSIFICLIYVIGMEVGKGFVSLQTPWVMARFNGIKSSDICLSFLWECSLVGGWMFLILPQRFAEKA